METRPRPTTLSTNCVTAGHEVMQVLDGNSSVAALASVRRARRILRARCCSGGRVMNGCAVCRSQCRQWAVAPGPAPPPPPRRRPIPTLRESCHYFRDDRHSPQPTIYTLNRRKLSRFSSSIIRHSHPLRRFALALDVFHDRFRLGLYPDRLKAAFRSCDSISAAPYDCA